MNRPIPPITPSIRSSSMLISETYTFLSKYEKNFGTLPLKATLKHKYDNIVPDIKNSQGVGSSKKNPAINAGIEQIANIPANIL